MNVLYFTEKQGKYLLNLLRLLECKLIFDGYFQVACVKSPTQTAGDNIHVPEGGGTCLKCVRGYARGNKFFTRLQNFCLEMIPEEISQRYTPKHKIGLTNNPI